MRFPEEVWFKTKLPITCSQGASCVFIGILMGGRSIGDFFHGGQRFIRGNGRFIYYGTAIRFYDSKGRPAGGSGPYLKHFFTEGGEMARDDRPL